MSMLKDQLIKEHGWAVESLEERNKDLESKRSEWVYCKDRYRRKEIEKEIEEMERHKMFEAGMVHAYESLMSVFKFENEEG